jgi:outer membrane lipoprotein-sorting protein
MRYFLLTLLMTSFSALGQKAPPPAADLLKDSDRARGSIGSGVSWEIDLDTLEDGTTAKIHYVVKAKGNDALSEATEPPRNKGEVMLFNDQNIWFFKPGLRKPVAISARQKLMGQAANGDIASTNYYRDYEGKVVGEETVDGTPCWRLELKARSNHVTYDGIRYWISQKDRLGVKAEFLTVSGEMFKSATFEYKNKITVNGAAPQPFVSKMTILDPLKPANKTVISFQSPRAEPHADSLFNVNNIVRWFPCLMGFFATSKTCTSKAIPIAA